MDGVEPVSAEQRVLETEAEETFDSSQEQTDDDTELESPPEYDSIDTGSHPPLDYDAVVALKAEESGPQDSLTAAAPPSYTQLFPKGKGSEDGRRGGTRRVGRRRHTQSRVQRERDGRAGSIVTTLMNKLQRMNKTTFGCIILVGASIIAGIATAMMTVGFVNFRVCKSTSIPLYLVVAGFFLIFDLLYHLCLFCWERLHDSEDNDHSTIYALRRCDCIAFFLFVWLLVGSNWIFRMGVIGNNCQLIDDGGVMLPPTYPPNSTQVPILNDSLSDVESRISRFDSIPRSSVDPGVCLDCSDGVYIFTVMVIMMQYIVGLALVVCCCSSFLRYRSRSR